MSRAKHWVFTLNNYTDEEVVYLTNLVSTSEDVSYVAWGCEVAPATGTIHLQGILSLRVRRRLAQVRSLVPRAHLEVRKGSHQQAKDYASKDGEFVEYGEEPAAQGSRSDLLAVKESLDNGANMRDISDEHFAQFCRWVFIFLRSLLHTNSV